MLAATETPHMIYVRKVRKQAKKERQIILAEIDRLEFERCGICVQFNSVSPLVKVNCKCEAAVKIRELGTRLEFRGAVKDLDPDSVTFDTLTVEQFWGLKALNMTDAQMLKLFKIGHKRLIKWKDDNGVSKRGKARLTQTK